MRLKSEEGMVESLVASGRRICEVMTDNAREVSMREMREICAKEGPTLSTTAWDQERTNLGRLVVVLRMILVDFCCLGELEGPNKRLG